MCREQGLHQTTGQCTASLLLPTGGIACPCRKLERFQWAQYRHFNCTIHRNADFQRHKVASPPQCASSSSDPREAATLLQKARIDKTAGTRPKRIISLQMDVSSSCPLLQDQVHARVLQRGMRRQLREGVLRFNHFLQTIRSKADISVDFSRRRREKRRRGSNL